MPILFRLNTVARVLNLPYFPVTVNSLLMGPVGYVTYFPVKIKFRVLDPVSFDVEPGLERYSRSRVMDEAENIRATPPGLDPRHAARAPQHLVRLSHGAARADHRAGHLLGRPHGPGPGGRGRCRDDPRPGGQRAPGPPRAHRIRPLRPEVLDPQPDRTGHPGRHHRAYVPRDQLGQRVHPGPPRDQRHRDPQPAGRGRLGRILGAPGRGEVLDPHLRFGGDGPGLVPRGGLPPEPGPHPGRAVPHRGRSRWSATSPRTTRTWWCRCSGSPMCSAPTSSPR